MTYEVRPTVPADWLALAGAPAPVAHRGMTALADDEAQAIMGLAYTGPHLQAFLNIREGSPERHPGLVRAGLRAMRQMLESVGRPVRVVADGPRAPYLLHWMGFAPNGRWNGMDVWTHPGEPV